MRNRVEGNVISYLRFQVSIFESKIEQCMYNTLLDNAPRFDFSRKREKLPPFITYNDQN